MSVIPRAVGIRVMNTRTREPLAGSGVQPGTCCWLAGLCEEDLEAGVETLYCHERATWLYQTRYSILHSHSDLILLSRLGGQWSLYGRPLATTLKTGGIIPDHIPVGIDHIK